MRKSRKFPDEPLGEIQVTTDFLPAPSELVYKEDTVKVTLGNRFWKRSGSTSTRAYAEPFISWIPPRRSTQGLSTKTLDLGGISLNIDN